MTLTIDKAGRLLIPKGIRESLHLASGTKLNLEIVGDKLQLSEAPLEAKIERRGSRRVIAGWEAFDATKAIHEMRRAQADRLEGPR